QKQTDAACDVVKELLTAPPAQKPITGDRLDLATLDSIGVVYGASPKHARTAINLFEQAARRYTDDPHVFFYLGRSYADLGKDKEAQVSFDRTLHLARTLAESSKGAERKQW